MLVAVGHPSERHETIGGDAGRGLRENAVHHREDRGIAADDERDEDDGGGAERGRAPEDADADLQIGRELLDRGPRPDRSGCLLRERAAAELGERAAARRVGRLAAVDTILDRHPQVRLELLVYLLVPAATEPRQPAHG